jgi:hypothetical protein
MILIVHFRVDSETDLSELDQHDFSDQGEECVRGFSYFNFGRLLDVYSYPLPYTCGNPSRKRHVPSKLSGIPFQVAVNNRRQPTSAYVSIRQHTSAYVSIRQHTVYLREREKKRACVCVCVCVLCERARVRACVD